VAGKSIVKPKWYMAAYIYISAKVLLSGQQANNVLPTVADCVNVKKLNGF
jgi:hypothetical protein